MGRKRYKISVELFSEKTGEVVREKRFHNQEQFMEFLDSYKDMRCPGYGWRYKDKVENQVKH